jgi:hypothetical protein
MDVIYTRAALACRVLELDDGELDVVTVWAWKANISGGDLGI